FRMPFRCLRPPFSERGGAVSSFAPGAAAFRSCCMEHDSGRLYAPAPAEARTNRVAGGVPSPPVKRPPGAQVNRRPAFRRAAGRKEKRPWDLEAVVDGEQHPVLVITAQRQVGFSQNEIIAEGSGELAGQLLGDLQAGADAVVVFDDRHEGPELR